MIFAFHRCHTRISTQAMREARRLEWCCRTPILTRTRAELYTLSRRTRTCRRARLRRNCRQRAPSERLRPDAFPRRDGGGAVATDQERQDRDPRQRFLPARASAHAGRRARHDRLHHRRPIDQRHGARHRRRVLLDGRQPGDLARALPGGPRSRGAGLDQDRAVCVRRQVLPLRIRQPVAAPLPAAASADLGASTSSTGPSNGPRIRRAATSICRPIRRSPRSRYLNIAMLRPRCTAHGELRPDRWSTPVYVAETDQKARDEAKPHPVPVQPAPSPAFEMIFRPAISA